MEGICVVVFHTTDRRKPPRICQELPDVIPPYGVIIMNYISALLVNQAPRQPSMTKMCLLLCMASGRLFILSAPLCFTGAVSSN